MSRFLFRLALILPIFLSTSRAQTTIQSSPTAVSLASASLLAAVGLTVLTDVTLQGRVNYSAGSDEESGTFALEVKGSQESKLTLGLSDGQRQEIRQLQAGAWVDAEGVQHPMAIHNCWVDASTVFPAFSLGGALSNPQVVAVYLGQTSLEGITVDHLQLSRVVPGQSPGMTAEIQKLSALDLYLDAATHLPVALDFSIHPDDDLKTQIPVEIQFSNYQKMNGIVVSTHIQKLIQGTLALDFFISNITLNSGVSDTEFAVQSVQGGN